MTDVPGVSRNWQHREVKELYESIMAKDYGFTDSEHRTLVVGLTALDNSISAQMEFDRYGPLIDGRFPGTLIANPAGGMVDKYHSRFLAVMKQLGLADPFGGESKQGRGAQGPRTK